MTVVVPTRDERANVAPLVAAVAEAQLNPYNVYVGGKNKIRYDRFEWYTYRTPHFVISYYDRVEPSLEKIASMSQVIICAWSPPGSARKR